MSLIQLMRRVFGNKEEPKTNNYFFEYTPEELSAIAVDRSTLKAIISHDGYMFREMDISLRMVYDMALDEIGFAQYWDIRKTDSGELVLDLSKAIAFNRSGGAATIKITRKSNGWFVENLPEHLPVTVKMPFKT